MMRVWNHVFSCLVFSATKSQLENESKSELDLVWASYIQLVAFLCELQCALFLLMTFYIEKQVCSLHSSFLHRDVRLITYMYTPEAMKYRLVWLVIEAKAICFKIMPIKYTTVSIEFITSIAEGL